MSFKVKVEPSGHSFDVDAGEVILDAALRHGLSFSYACRNGVCGACKGQVLSGEVTYGDGLPAALSEDEAASGEMLLCSAIPTSDLVMHAQEIGAASEVPIRKMPARVVALERLSSEVMRLNLKLPDTDRMQFLAGQYIDILLKDGRRRSFSIANAPHDDEFIELHIRHIQGGEFTGHVFDGMQLKDILRIEGPYGSFTMREDADLPMIFVAGGTGFAPVKGIIEHAFQEGVGRPIVLYWGARTREALYLSQLPESWLAHDNFSYVPVLSVPDAADEWQGRTGFVHEAVLDDYDDLSGCEVYASGPPVMVDAAREAFVKRGVLKENFLCDSFEFAEE